MQKVKKVMEKKNQKQFVLIHGLCHGAWTWYKVKTQLEAEGHRVTAVDLVASGINMTKLEEIQTLIEYTKPLLDVLSSHGSDDEKVILVAHSMGGIPAALASDIFPRKIAAIVFVTSFMPDTKNPPAYVYEKSTSSTSQVEWLDTVFGIYGRPDRPLEFALVGPKFMAKNVYQLSPLEDLVLAKMLVRVNPIVTNNLAGTRSFSEERYGSVTRIYIVCGEDLTVPEDYQRWMISNFPPKEVMEIKDADHMAMFSKPQELCALLLEIADKYA
ncbi:methylesterase 4 isoform X2 [Eutrema salsugineum]|uniref:methylesterase 4 isoform X2 n=1 Tax=Eutrema salsugineum TaxID=72664 RepID=UPI000CED4677|nr:methylesterase 4 isoform X2 [Eutrema salsugineum]